MAKGTFLEKSILVSKVVRSLRFLCTCLGPGSGISLGLIHPGSVSHIAECAEECLVTAHKCIRSCGLLRLTPKD